MKENNNNLVDKAKQFVSKGQLLLAINELSNILMHCSKKLNSINSQNDIILLKARLIELNREKNRGGISTEDYHKLRNQISFSIISTIDLISIDLEEDNKEQNHFKELESFEEIELIINKKLIDYSIEDKNKLLNAIEELASINGTIKITRIKEGSIKLIIEIPKDKVNLIISLINEGGLNDYDVIKASSIAEKLTKDKSLKDSSQHIYNEELNLRKAIIGLLIKVGNADGKADDITIKFISGLAQQFGLSKEEFNKVLKNPEKYEINTLPPEQERMTILYYVLFTITVDGIISEEEERMCFEIGLKLGFNKYMTRDLINVMKRFLDKDIPQHVILNEIKKRMN